MRKGAWVVDRALEEAVLGGFTVSPSGPYPGVKKLSSTKAVWCQKAWESLL